MSAHTITSVQTLAKLGGDGAKICLVTGTLSASYDTGGSVIDLSSYFGDEVLSITGTCQGTTLTHLTYVPAASNAPATGKIACWDKDGTQETATDDLSAIVFQALVVGTDA